MRRLDKVKNTVKLVKNVALGKEYKIKVTELPILKKSNEYSLKY